MGVLVDNSHGKFEGIGADTKTKEDDLEGRYYERKQQNRDISLDSGDIFENERQRPAPGIYPRIASFCIRREAIGVHLFET